MRLLLRDTLLRTVLVYVAVRYAAADGAGVRMLLRDTAADAAGERMLLRNTLLRTLLV